MTLQASTFAVAIPSSAVTPLRRHRNLFTVRAQVEPTDKNVEIMRKFSEQYARKSGTYFCVDKGVTSVVIKGLADHKDSLGAPLCPCRHYDDKPAEASQGFWNCPCVPMRERSAIACSFSLLTMILLARNRPSPWMRLKKQQQICNRYDDLSYLLQSVSFE
ncbi:hypothetical protein TanjilG_04082 [Lupinus angustifolius]|uniref:Ferredoxin-thioredoxin reductase catalytic chain, chloroplastic n=1 Tax=Lupinus angustifolius TaxID=3871 RepID=A0A4P1RB79_LUPAN|nr:hypothetical protein TanjilG_04082 [Lupinus angustifolius]